MPHVRTPYTLIIFAILLGIICTVPPAGASQDMNNFPQKGEINPVFLEWAQQQNASLDHQTCMHCSNPPIGDIPSPKVVLWPVQRASLFALDGDADYPTEPYFNLADEGRVTGIRDQGNCGSCWAFTSLASLESWLLPGETWDFSENNLKNLHGFDIGPCSGGNADMATAYLARWGGPVLEADDPYSASSTPNSPSGLDVQKHLQEAVILPPRSSATDNGLIKQKIKEEGGLQGAITVDWSYFGSPNGYGYETYYNPSYQSSGGHAICIVGWDDTFPASNFTVTPPGDGAFICKNSWGTGVGWNGTGYFYLSYYDANFAIAGGSRPETCYFTAEPTTSYDHIYQYDPLGWVMDVGYGSGSGNWMANVFTAESDEDLKAVSFYATTTDVDYDIRVYVNPSQLPKAAGDTAQAHTTGTLDLPGYHTVSLAESVSLDAGDTFSVVVQLDSADSTPIAVERPYAEYSSGATASGKGYVSSTGGSWTRIDSVYSGTDVCLKAFTDDEEIPILPDAAYVSDTIPETVAAGEQYTVQVTMLNNGTKPWSESEFIRLGAAGDGGGDAALFGTTRATIAPETTVNPGEQYTFTFNLTAPETPGTYNPRYRLVCDGEPPSWFGETVDKTVQVQGPNAAYISDTIPKTMVAGEQYDVQVTMQNTGTTTWSEDELIRLGAVGNETGDATLFGTMKVGIAQGTTVNPSEQYTFTINMTAPQAPGTYNPQYRMLWDGEPPSWFGEIVTTTIQVDEPQIPDASFVSDTIPATMTPGQQHTVQVTMLNNGTKPWSEDDLIRLGAVGDGTGDAALFGPTRVAIAQGTTVGPEEQNTFTFTMTAPQTTGTYKSQYRMLCDGEMPSWFGEIVNTTIQVEQPLVPGAAVVSNTIPATMTPGQKYSVQVTMLNTGTKPWSEADRIRLGAVGDGAGDAALFGTGRVKIPQGTTVEPGEQYTFTFTMTAPETPGTYSPKYRMVWELRQWFGDKLEKTVQVGGSQEPDAAVVGDTIPTTMTPGQQYSVQVTMLNTGTKPWSETDRIRLGAVGDGAGDAALFGTGRVKIPQGTTVGPGEQYTFTFTMTAPETTGTYYPKYRMVWELHQWFGENLTRTVAIA